MSFGDTSYDKDLDNITIKKDSAFDCFTLCIQKEDCASVSRLYPHKNNWGDCFMKVLSSNTTKIIEGSENGYILGTFQLEITLRSINIILFL